MECKTCEELQIELYRIPGDKVNILLGDTLQEKVVLVHKRPSWSDTTPYPIQEAEDGCTQVNAVTAMWVVDICPQDKFQIPFRTSRKIIEFHSCGEFHIPDEDDNDEEE